ncbi:MAG TPA: BON domain-containing protein [Blastocatellia bacterium]|nr:BON domain-containing protein [Blastocatellia bacterium]
MKKIINTMVALAMFFAVAGSPALAAPQKDGGNAALSRQVRKNLVTLPFYGVFDNLAYEVNGDGDTVTLYGQVTRPITRKDAERRVAKIEGVERVINRIEVLPVSPFDDRIRARTYRAVFNSGGLYRYAMGANPSIHIVVNRGHVTLEGVVSGKMDKQLAYMAARQVPGVFSVTNNLVVEGED